MSPREVGRELAAAELRKIDAMNAEIHIAWRTAYYSRRARSKRGLPKLKGEFITDAAATKKAKKVARQTKDETATMIRMLAEMYGGTIQRVEA